jgi:hypothetical protein
MRASSARRPRGPLSRTAARNAALLNQCATPGLGSLVAGRRVAGVGQLLLALVGFGLFAVWVVLLSIQLYNLFTDGKETASQAWLGEAGAGIFAAAWLWSLATSWSILRQARGQEPPVLGRPPTLPP